MNRDAQIRLEALQERIQDEMERIEAVAPEWLSAPPNFRACPSFNVVVCGAGLSGLSIAFGLRRRGIGGILTLDQSEAGREGPWVTSARMKTLRSPKYLSGPDFGIPSLTPRSWYEASKGPGAWDQLDKMSRFDWMDYLVWYRQTTGTEVQNGVELVGVRPEGDGLILSLEYRADSVNQHACSKSLFSSMMLSEKSATFRHHAQEGNTTIKNVYCRHLVLATGMEGCGGPHIPEQVKALPKSLWTHSAECGDMDSMRARHVAILGSATSAIDWAVTALDAGACEVTLLARARDMPQTEVLAFTNFPGFLLGFGELSDLERWRLAQLYFNFKVPPTQDQYDRALTYPNFSLVMGCEVRAISVVDGKLRIETNQEAVIVDHLLLGTGYEIDLMRRSELAGIADRILRWCDHFSPPEGEEAPEIGAYPYLGPMFELKPKNPDMDSWLSRIHLFNAGAIPSLGPVSNGVTGLKYGLARIVDGLVKALFAEEVGQIHTRLAAYDEKHFDPRQSQSCKSNA